jgi:HPt (histidine-containing phosphotransfer) domain-containing protein
VVKIPGVNEEKVLDLYEGDTELYLKALEAFVVNTPKLLDRMQAVSEETLKDYIACLHGLKGVCTTVCVEEARKKAVYFETIAKAGNISGVLAGNESFLNYMRDLLVDIQNWIKNNKV